MVYLARKYDSSRLWSPLDPETSANITLWLGVAEKLASTVGAARLHDTLFYEVDIDRVRASAHKLLRILDEHLWFAEQEGADWLCSRGHPTLADIACFPYVMLCEEGGISRLPYPAIRRWCNRVKRVERFATMPGFFPAAAAADPARTRWTRPGSDLSPDLPPSASMASKAQWPAAMVVGVVAQILNHMGTVTAAQAPNATHSARASRSTGQNKERTSSLRAARVRAPAAAS